ncbi:glutamate dehydrogenase, mitochondrial-like [Sitophilus oryzae]|uniref:Glutamate dehydrogenase n=1 Tax=Sitophilus oryzae TaxID=7048 RepID=A0A6J2XMN4_SITOR|nr:glutamate dehydrogenase, mitochondrial-like [Sitophilus oryzae]
MLLVRKSNTSQIRSISQISNKYARLSYEIPERYQNAFYLANAAFFDSTSWFLHRAYEVAFPALKNDYRSRFKDEAVGDRRVHEKLENVIEVLDQCNSIIDVRFPIRKDDGTLELIRGFRAHHGENIARSPCLGGLRIDENITRDHMKALSLLSTMKNCCMGIGMSGAHGGIKIDPRKYSKNELRTIVDLYITELFNKGYCGHLDVIHPDINTGQIEMQWISESFAKCSGQNMNVAAVGKPLAYGGLEDYEKTAALGALKALDVFLEDVPTMDYMKSNVGMKNKKFIIQGLGKVGRPLALMLVEHGAICVGVKEQDAYLYDSKGIDLQELLKHKDETGSIERYKLTKTDNPDSIFKEDCDILVLSACHKSLVCYVAREVKAKIILEASDGPTTPTAHKILTTKSKLVIPDIYACSGSNVASYLEYLRNLQQMGVREETILKFSNETYGKIIEKISMEDQKQMAGGAHSKNVHTLFAPLDFHTTKSTIECIFTEMGEEILKNIRSHRLGTDARTAAYIIVIKNMFEQIYNLKKLI